MRVPAAFAAPLVLLALGGCGGNSKPAATSPSTTSPVKVAIQRSAPKPKPKPKPSFPPYPQLLAGAFGSQPTAGFVPAVSWQGQTAAWIARTTSGVALLSFDQQLLELHLHAGSGDEGVTGWRYGSSASPSEVPHLAAAFNGGFKFSTSPGGFESYGHTAVPLQTGLGSVVTYADGGTDVGSWNREVPAPGRAVVSVRQNLPLLIDRGSAAANIDCVSCWGATLGGVIDPARSALGITANGRLIWAGGEHLTVAALADALLGAHVVRAVELDINPEWVNAYLYGHRGGKGPPAPVPIVSGQNGIPGQFLAPWSRDFFTIVGR
jgi:hypothetical protein